MKIRDALLLGRVSNLPTVWSNVLAGATLSGAILSPAARPALAAIVLAVSLLYLAGMYLNDAFDRRIDARERPERPIPAGRVTAATVFTAGFAMMASGLLLLAVMTSLLPPLPLPTALPPMAGALPLFSGAALAAAIVAYDAYHKGNRFSPVIMGLCRALVYVTSAVAFAAPTSGLFLAAVLLWSYLIGLTYAAKQESLDRIGSLWPLSFLAVPFLYALPIAVNSLFGALLFASFAGWTSLAVHRLFRRQRGDVPRAVAALLAGICLLDGLVILGQGQPGLALVATALFPLTLAAQRFVPAT
ncbi:UbiA family prenyltransferase [Defluviicoccus vanus]|uniref:UbiA family prenyltransferase n=2 Tax=Defluviicoccus vanus TaxID=111831 RepID=A0A7H1N5R1_9PROT|nr:UbiA family prenyltransferase [Defluviicoccus vanus]